MFSAQNFKLKVKMFGSICVVQFLESEFDKLCLHSGLCVGGKKRQSINSIKFIFCLVHSMAFDSLYMHKK